MPIAINEAEYLFGDLDLMEIRNYNEVRVISSMRRILGSVPEYEPNDIDIQDIYALAVSSLPPRYRQFGIEVYREEVTDAMVDEAVFKAVQAVREHPNH